MRISFFGFSVVVSACGADDEGGEWGEAWRGE